MVELIQAMTYYLVQPTAHAEPEKGPALIAEQIGCSDRYVRRLKSDLCRSELGSDLHTRTVGHWATDTVATTKGTVHEIDQDGRPFSN